MTLLISDICSWFHKQQGATRLDTVVSLLQMLYPLELQFVGVCLEDLMRSENHRLRDVEQRLNLPEIVARLTDLNDSRCRASLIVALSLLKGTNYSTATAVCKILLEFYVVYRQMPRTKDVLDELLLLLTMVKYHPAFKFDQKTNIANLCDDILNFINQNQTQSLPQSATTATTSSSVPSTPLLENGPRSQNSVEEKERRKFDDKEENSSTLEKHFLQSSLTTMKKSSDHHQRNQKNQHHHHNQQDKGQNRGNNGVVINHYSHNNNNNTSSSDRAPRNHNYHARAASSPSCRSQSYKTPSTAAAPAASMTMTRVINNKKQHAMNVRKNVSNSQQNPTPSNRHDSSSNNNEYVFVNSRYKHNNANVNNGATTPEGGCANLALLDQQQRNSCTPPATSRQSSQQPTVAAETSRPQHQNYDAAGGDNRMTASAPPRVPYQQNLPLPPAPPAQQQQAPTIQTPPTPAYLTPPGKKQQMIRCQMPTAPSPPPPQAATLNFQTAMTYGGPRTFPAPVTYNLKNGNGNVPQPPPPLSANGAPTALPFFASQLLPLRFICGPPPQPNAQQPPPQPPPFCQCYAAALAANGNVLQNGSILMTQGPPTICPACLMKCGAQYME